MWDTTGEITVCFLWSSELLGLCGLPFSHPVITFEFLEWLIILQSVSGDFDLELFFFFFLNSVHTHLWKTFSLFYSSFGSIHLLFHLFLFSQGISPSVSQTGIPDRPEYFHTKLILYVLMGTLKCFFPVMSSNSSKQDHCLYPTFTQINSALSSPALVQSRYMLTKCKDHAVGPEPSFLHLNCIYS